MKTRKCTRCKTEGTELKPWCPAEIVSAGYACLWYATLIERAKAESK